jgi:hypothetical protein
VYNLTCVITIVTYPPVLLTNREYILMYITHPFVIKTLLKVLFYMYSSYVLIYKVSSIALVGDPSPFFIFRGNA